MASSPRELISRARTYDNIGALIAGGLGGTFLALFESGINVIQAIVGILTYPLRALGVNLGGVVTSFVGGGARIIEQGAVTTVQALIPGSTWAVGPLTFVFGIVAAGGGLFVMSELLARAPTSNLIPFSFTDVPFVGVDESAEDEDGEG